MALAWPGVALISAFSVSDLKNALWIEVARSYCVKYTWLMVARFFEFTNTDGLSLNLMTS